MKLLVVHDQHRLADHISQQLSPRVEDIHVLAIDWLKLADLDDAVAWLKQQSIDRMICAVALSNTASPADKAQLTDCLEKLCLVAAASKMPLMFLSSAAVFTGAKHHYNEDDEPQPLNDIGVLYLQLEGLISRRLSNYIILRSSWIFSSHADNFLSQVIESAAADQLISLNSAGKGCPTAIADLSRVFLAMVLQLDVGAENSGIYHYCSSDPALGFQFMEAILAQASQFNENIDAKNQRFSHDDNIQGLLYFEPVVLHCDQLLDDFGIHQKPWRLMLSAAVNAYFNGSDHD